MWAAANDGSAISRRRRHHVKRRRTDEGDFDGPKAKGQDDNDTTNKGSDSDTDTSSDGERSTTESVQSSTQRAQGDNPAPAAAAAQHKKRKRKHKRKKKKKIRDETPEATMARLKSSYSAAMAGVGALHRVSQQYCTAWKEEEKKEGQENAGGEDCKKRASYLPVNGSGAENAAMGNEESAENDESNHLEGTKKMNEEMNVETTNAKEKRQEARSAIQRVARATRSALEQSLLLDHVILAPIFLADKKNKKGKKTDKGKENAPVNDSTDGMSSVWLGAWRRSSRVEAAETAKASSEPACQTSLSKWNRLSAAHRVAIKQISYLALINYSDLLLCGCSCHRSKGSGDGILDRGAVSSLDVLELFSSSDTSSPNQTEDDAMNDDMGDGSSTPADNYSGKMHSLGCLWSDESAEWTIRLALAAYCDASELDPTDPTLWFKLACAARALGREVDRSSSSSSSSSRTGSACPPRSYRCLERLALGRGMSSLPRGVPPNRLLTRAWREMEHLDRRPTVVDVSQDMQGADASGNGAMSLDDDKRPIELVLHLPRYSWLTLGRILIRACREGASYGRSLPDGALHHVWSTNCNSPEDYEFGSPLVDVRISSLLATPPCVIGRICEYLEEYTDIKCLKCTCRAMPSEIDTARVKITEAKRSSLASAPAKDIVCLEDVVGKSAAEKYVIEGTSTDVTFGCDAGTTSASKAGSNQSETDFILPPRRGRISVRVLSQMISSEKQTERNSKRSSVEYCLLAGALSCTAQNPHYTKLLKMDINWEQLPLVKKCMQKLPALSCTFIEGRGPNAAGPFRTDKNAKLSCQMNLVNAFIAPSSLKSFVTTWSRHNSGPRNFLEMFLLHVSLNTGDVFETEVVDSMSSCVIDCFDAITAERHTEFAPWYGLETFQTDGNLEHALHALAVNLLNAELRFKRCESHDVGSHEHHEDSDALAFIVPNLLQLVSGMSQLEVSNDIQPIVFQLKCRCYWLCSSYHLWIGRCNNDASISKGAEDFGLECLNEAIKLLSEHPQIGDDVSIKTPQLESSGRRGCHWSVVSAGALSKYREHLQSSSIVSRARQLFQEIRGSVQGRSGPEGDEENISADDKAKLASLGAELLERYTGIGDGEKSRDVLEELLKDFLLLHEDHLHASDANSHLSSEHASNCTGEKHWGRIWTYIPSSKAASVINISREAEECGSRPSILQILASSLIASEESHSCPSVFLIFSKVVLTALLLRAQMLRKQSSGDSQVDFEERKLASIDDDQFIDDTKNRRMLLVVNFFTDKMTDMIASNNYAEMHNALEAFIDGEEFCSIIFTSLNGSLFHPKDAIDKSTLHLRLFQSFSRLVLALRECQGLSRQTRDKVESVYFVTLVKSMILQKEEFVDLMLADDKRLKKWQSKFFMKADLIFSVANEIADLMSTYSSTINSDGSVTVSHLIKAITDPEGDESPITQLSGVLIWFWKFMNNDSFDSSLVRNRILVPIYSAIISLCGSPGVPISDESSDKCTLSFSDYFDSEDSVNGLFLPDGAAEEEDQEKKRILLRKICQLVQCISLLFQSVDEKQMCPESMSVPFPSSKNGHFLPLVSVRVLSTLSDAMFQLFGESVWGVAYPYGARDCGNLIDKILGKAYLHLYGFSFFGAEDKTKNHAPESIKAAAQLFRCIKRVYHDNRRSPPSKAFETVELALPPANETEVSKGIRTFFFDAEKKVDVVNSATEMPQNFSDIEWVFSEADNVSLSGQEHQGNIDRLRRGICHELAKGPITNLDSSKKSPSDMDDQGLSEERESSELHELSLAQKFKAVLECLCYHPTKIENWIVLSECCGFKAEYICDRLVPIQESYDSFDFCLQPESKRQCSSTMTLDQLQKHQYLIFQESRCDWTPFIGNDLYVYMKYSWSNFSSLRACANDIGSTLVKHREDTEGSNADGQNSDYLCWEEIESKFRNGNYVQWANSWAGLFVMALRTMRAKALLVARYLAKKSQQGMHPSEVMEDIGTALFCNLMASTVYGYPMHPLTLHEKRKIAERSLSALREAIQLSASSDYTQRSQTICWEIQFLAGKCHEKIATTLREEMYSLCSAEGEIPARLYETNMADAMRNYSEAFAGAQKSEQISGGPDKSCIGGSSHGALECLYRIHASRLKVLVSAIRRAKEECELAELEAYRIASVTWFDESNQSSTGVRGKIWDVFADCVDALSHCRREIPLFHRAAYRLAQAYSWAPAFHNPDCDLALGSKQAVPAIKSYRIRGLDTGSCAESAAVVMNTLFEKRRAQLCAVWVTTSARPPPFEVLNDSLRKYDALRLKYIRAFIDCMRVCDRKDKIETLLNCATTSNQDLPGFYEASASLRGGDPGRLSRRSLLKGSGKSFTTTVKRNAIRALAEMALKELAVLKENGVDNEGKMKLTHLFKSAYKLFLRLNSPCKEVVEFIRSNNKQLIEIEAFCKCYLSIQAGYRISSIHFDGMDSDTLCSILEGAVSKAKDLSRKGKE